MGVLVRQVESLTAKMAFPFFCRYYVYPAVIQLGFKVAKWSRKFFGLAGNGDSRKQILRLNYGNYKCWDRRIEERHEPIWIVDVILQIPPAKANPFNCDTGIA